MGGWLFHFPWANSFYKQRAAHSAEGRQGEMSCLCRDPGEGCLGSIHRDGERVLERGTLFGWGAMLVYAARRWFLCLLPLLRWLEPLGRSPVSAPLKPVCGLALHCSGAGVGELPVDCALLPSETSQLTHSCYRHTVCRRSEVCITLGWGIILLFNWTLMTRSSFFYDCKKAFTGVYFVRFRML